ASIEAFSSERRRTREQERRGDDERHRHEGEERKTHADENEGAVVGAGAPRGRVDADEERRAEDGREEDLDPTDHGVSSVFEALLAFAARKAATAAASATAIVAKMLVARV